MWFHEKRMFILLFSTNEFLYDHMLLYRNINFELIGIILNDNNFGKNKNTARMVLLLNMINKLIRTIVIMQKLRLNEHPIIGFITKK